MRFNLDLFYILCWEAFNSCYQLEFLFYYHQHYLTPSRFLHQFELVVFNWNQNDSKFPQVSKTHLSIQADSNIFWGCLQNSENMEKLNIWSYCQR